MELVPKHVSLPLKKGTWCHALLQALWLEQSGIGEGWEAKHEELSEGFGQLFEEEQERYGDLPSECERLFKAYLRRWRDDGDKYRVARLPSGAPAVEFVVEVPLDKWGIKNPFKGRVDLLVEDLEYGGFWIRDAKWVKSIPIPDERMMSPQNLMYTWAVRRMVEPDVRGFIYDYGRTKSPTVPDILKRPMGYVTKKKNLDTDVHTYLARILEAHGRADAKRLVHTYYREKLLEIMARDTLWFRRERIPIEPERVKRALMEFILAVREIEGRNRKNVPRTYLYDCKWNCSYHEPCVAEFQGLDIEPLLKRRFVLEEETYGQTQEELVG